MLIARASLGRSLVEASQVFSFSWATVSVIIVVSLLVLIILPPSRRLIAKAFPIEVSVEGRRSVAEAYVEFLSSRGLSVEEALEFKNGVASILVGEGNVLPRLEKAVDHAVLLVSDSSTIPPRREIHVLVEASEPEGVEAVSSLVREYSGRTGLRAVGIIVCEEVDDGLLSLVKGLRDAEVVCVTRRILGF